MNGSGGWVWKYYNEEDNDFDFNDDEVKTRLRFLEVLDQVGKKAWNKKYLWEKWASRVWRFWVPEEQ